MELPTSCDNHSSVTLGGGCDEDATPPNVPSVLAIRTDTNSQAEPHWDCYSVTMHRYQDIVRPYCFEKAFTIWGMVLKYLNVYWRRAFLFVNGLLSRKLSPLFLKTTKASDWTWRNLYLSAVTDKRWSAGLGSVNNEHEPGVSRNAGTGSAGSTAGLVSRLMPCSVPLNLSLSLRTRTAKESPIKYQGLLFSARSSFGGFLWPAARSDGPLLETHWRDLGQ